MRGDPGGRRQHGHTDRCRVRVRGDGLRRDAQFLLTMLERARDLGRDLPLRRALVTGAPLPPPLRARLQDEFGVDVYQSYGTADAGTLGYECEVKDGWHVATEIVVRGARPGRRSPGGGGRGRPGPW